MTWQLRPGVGLARRDAEHVQLGADPPHVAILPDRPAVRLLLVELAHGGPLAPLDDTTGAALQELVRAGLVESRADQAVRRARRSRCGVHLDVPDSIRPGALQLVGDAGLGLASRPSRASVALVWSEGELARDRLDDLIRSDTPHLVVREALDGPVVGPYVDPGATACLRCVDAHAGEADPRRGLVVEQLATVAPLRDHAPDAVLRALALAWAVRDIGTAAEGGVPVTWSATVALGALPPVVTAYHRHLHCGCAWADDVAG